MMFEEIIPLIIFLAIPMVAIIGGIVNGIVKTNARTRMMELSHRERIAALERGVDPNQLPPLKLPEEGDRLSFPERQLKASQTLLITGLAFGLGGLAFAFFLMLVEPREAVWPMGLIFTAVGLALFIGSTVMKPSKEDLEDARRARQREAELSGARPTSD